MLQDPYPYDKGRLVVKEMADSLSLDLVEKRLVTDQMVLTVGYDVENLKDGRAYGGPVETDRYGRSIPKEAHGSINLEHRTSSSKTIVEAVARLYDRIVNPKLLVRRMYVVASRVVDETTAQPQMKPEQLDLFTDYKALEEQRAKEQADAERERKAQEALLAIRQKLGKNAILRGMNLEGGATARDRNRQIGGHKA